MGKEAAEEGSEEAAPEPSPEDIAEKIIADVETAEETVEEPVVNLTENITEDIQPNISGTLDLQADLDLCPHLKREFDCNRYDVRWCETERIAGKEGFLPEYMNCRDGETSKGEKKDHKYCLLMDCGPVAEENIVTQYGEYVAYAEYAYTFRQQGNTIITHYRLTRCGEEEKGFPNVNECRYYGSKIGKP